MHSEWRNEERTIAAVIHDNGHVVIVEPDSPEWEDVVAMPPAAYVAPDPEVLLARAREEAWMPRGQFLRACVAAGIMQEVDALAAVSGQIPPSFSAIVEQWPPEQRFEAHMQWGENLNVRRLNPLIVEMAQAIDVSDEQLDELFGIGGVE